MLYEKKMKKAKEIMNEKIMELKTKEKRKKSLLLGRYERSLDTRYTQQVHNRNEQMRNFQ